MIELNASLVESFEYIWESLIQPRTYEEIRGFELRNQMKKLVWLICDVYVVFYYVVYDVELSLMYVLVVVLHEYSVVSSNYDHKHSHFLITICPCSVQMY